MATKKKRKSAKAKTVAKKSPTRKPAKAAKRAAPKKAAQAAKRRAPKAAKKPAPKAAKKPAPKKVAPERAESLELHASFAASPEEVLAAWLDSEKHSAFTGSDATIDARVGGKHSAWNGYIEGEILEIQPGKRLVMSWRTTEFPTGHPDSIVLVEAEPDGGGTELRLVHTELPPGGAEKCFKGWTEFYFVPMSAYFRG